LTCFAVYEYASDLITINLINENAINSHEINIFQKYAGIKKAPTNWSF